MSTMTTQVSATVANYIAAWNETDPDARRQLVASAVTDDVTYVDPSLAGEGIDGVTAMIGTAQQQMPGAELRLAGPVDTHHDRVRFSWEVIGQDGGSPILAGIDVAVVAPDGRMSAITGFFDIAPL